MRALLVAASLTVSFLAGCLTDHPNEGASAPTDDLAVAPVDVMAPTVDARATLDALKVFASRFPYRQSGQATHVGARDWLEQALGDFGLETTRHTFPATLRGLVPVAYDGENVIGIKWGTDREHWVVVGAHYDITEGAVHGTYDDGSGTIQTVKLAEAFADVDTTRTIAFVLFDQEERGLVGARAFVKDVLAGTFEHNVTVDAMIDLDMVGITHPHPAPLVAWINSPTLQNWSEDARKAAGVPDDKMVYRPPNGGSSDGAAFIDAGIPTAYYWSDWDQVVLANGMSYPRSYPFWHQADTYETMVVMAGDEATLEAGFQTLLDVVSPLLLRMATHPEAISDAPTPGAA